MTTSQANAMQIDLVNAVPPNAAAPNADLANADLARTGDECWTDRASRLTTILMVGRLIADGRDYLCRMRNVSSGGMMVECGATLAPDDRVRVELRNLNIVEGTVVWTSDARIGLRFDAPVNVAALLHSPTDRGDQRPRAPRLTGAGTVRLSYEGHESGAGMCDVSQSGCRVMLASPPPIGATVRIVARGLPPRYATLRWANGGLAGFEFRELLSFAELTAWQRDAGRFPG